jgi:DNA-directed RNA polymerase sigma subunit (sigma70/sigma32)
VLAAKQEADTSRQRVAATLSVLNDRERRIVEARFLADEPATLEALGAELGGVSKERIRQIEEKALAKLKLALTGQPQRPRFVPRPQLPYPPTAAELARLNPRERRVAEGRLIPGARITLRSLADEFGVAEPSISFAEARAYEKIMAWRASEDCSVALAMG